MERATPGETAEESAVASLALVHPGEILMAEFLEPLGISQRRLAVAIGVPPRRISEIVQGKRRITADTALGLARYYGTTARFWLNLQSRYDLEDQQGPPRRPPGSDTTTPLGMMRGR